MKPYCRILLACKNRATYASQNQPSSHGLCGNSWYMRLNFGHNRRIHGSSDKLLDSRPKIIHPQRALLFVEKGFGSPRVCPSAGATRTGLSVMRRNTCDVRWCSSSTVDSRVSDKSFEKIYVHGGANLKPEEVIERIHRAEENVGREQGNGGEEIENARDLCSEIKVQKTERQETEMEKEAWSLLQNSVVTYCNSPVGTVAANDPNDKLPLNYDQVFIRDFVPSALAFLLKGEGEIVKNFLLHTLQLQMWL